MAVETAGAGPIFLGGAARVEIAEYSQGVPATHQRIDRASARFHWVDRGTQAAEPARWHAGSGGQVATLRPLLGSDRGDRSVHPGKKRPSRLPKQRKTALPCVREPGSRLQQTVLRSGSLG